jgi:hypothetical protein
VELLLPTAENLYLALAHLVLAQQVMHHGMNLGSAEIAPLIEKFQFQTLT